MPQYKFNGYHGTSANAAQKILSTQYNLSLGYQEWLGDGVYLFIDGLSSQPQEQAKKWAIATAWDKYSKKYTYKEYAILETVISVDDDKLLDLSVEAGVEVLDYLCTKFESKIRNHQNNQHSKYKEPLDGFLINLARSEGIITIDATKGNFYIKFTEQRFKRYNFRTANATICAVFNVKENLSGNRIVEQGKIHQIKLKY